MTINQSDNQTTDIGPAAFVGIPGQSSDIPLGLVVGRFLDQALPDGWKWVDLGEDWKPTILANGEALK